MSVALPLESKNLADRFELDIAETPEDYWLALNRLRPTPAYLARKYHHRRWISSRARGAVAVSESRREEVRQTIALIRQGQTLSAIAEQVGISREGLRQRIFAAGFAEDYYVAFNERRAERAAAKAEERVAWDARKDERRLAHQINLGKVHRGRGLRYTDADLIACVQKASRDQGEPLSAFKFRRWLATQPGSPSERTFTIRFGSWPEACERAGVLSPTAVNGRTYGRRHVLTLADCESAVEACAAEYGRVPTHAEYDAWSRACGTTPCASVVRARFGNWLEVINHLLARWPERRR